MPAAVTKLRHPIEVVPLCFWRSRNAILSTVNVDSGDHLQNFRAMQDPAALAQLWFLNRRSSRTFSMVLSCRVVIWGPAARPLSFLFVGQGFCHIEEDLTARLWAVVVWWRA